MKQKPKNTEIKYANRVVTISGDTLKRYTFLADANGQTVEECVLEALKEATNQRTGTVDMLLGKPKAGEFLPIVASGGREVAVGYKDGQLVLVEGGEVDPVTLKDSLGLVLRLWVAEISSDECCTFNDWARCKWIEDIHAALD